MRTLRSSKTIISAHLGWGLGKESGLLSPGIEPKTFPHSPYHYHNPRFSIHTIITEPYSKNHLIIAPLQKLLSAQPGASSKVSGIWCLNMRQKKPGRAKNHSVRGVNPIITPDPEWEQETTSEHALSLHIHEGFIILSDLLTAWDCAAKRRNQRSHNAGFLKSSLIDAIWCLLVSQTIQLACCSSCPVSSRLEAH